MEAIKNKPAEHWQGVVSLIDNYIEQADRLNVQAIEDDNDRHSHSSLAPMGNVRKGEHNARSSHAIRNSFLGKMIDFWDFSKENEEPRPSLGIKELKVATFTGSDDNHENKHGIDDYDDDHYDDLDNYNFNENHDTWEEAADAIGRFLDNEKIGKKSKHGSNRTSKEIRHSFMGKLNKFWDTHSKNGQNSNVTPTGDSDNGNNDNNDNKNKKEDEKDNFEKAEKEFKITVTPTQAPVTNNNVNVDFDECLQSEKTENESGKIKHDKQDSESITTRNSVLSNSIEELLKVSMTQKSETMSEKQSDDDDDNKNNDDDDHERSRTSNSL